MSAVVAPADLAVRTLGCVPYAETVTAMQAFTAARGPESRDEIWLLSHAPVFTLGQAGRRAHLLRPSATPVVQTDRGGQITYHGPGQVIAYLLLDLRRRGLYVKEAVRRIEQAVIALLASYRIDAMRQTDAPGVYLRQADDVPGAKISAIGLKVRNGCTYHGVALNVAMDLRPFDDIDACGYPGLQTTDMATCLASPLDPDLIAQALAQALQHHLDPGSS